jgi:hypothetical protein
MTGRGIAIAKRRQFSRSTSIGWGVSMKTRMEKLGRYLRGWTNYFGKCVTCG